MCRPHGHWAQPAIATWRVPRTPLASGVYPYILRRSPGPPRGVRRPPSRRPSGAAGILQPGRRPSPGTAPVRQEFLATDAFQGQAARRQTRRRARHGQRARAGSARRARSHRSANRCSRQCPGIRRRFGSDGRYGDRCGRAPRVRQPRSPRPSPAGSPSPRRAHRSRARIPRRAHRRERQPRSPGVADGGALDTPNGVDHCAVSVFELGEVARRALDIGEQEGELAGRQFRPELAVDKANRQDSVALRRLEQAGPRAIPHGLVVEQEPVEARQGVADMRLVVDRQAAASVGVDVREGGIGKLRPFSCAQLSHAEHDRRIHSQA